MKRQLAFSAFAITAMVVIAFVVPLGLLIRRQAEDRALNQTQRQVESIATALAVTSGGAAISVTDAEVMIAALGDDSISVFLPSGLVAGNQSEPSENVQLARRGAAFSASIDGGAEVLVPTATASGETLVVRGFVPEVELRRGVTAAWALLALLGLTVTAVAMAVANRLALSVTAPVGELQATAHDMAEGKLDVRVDPAGPPEIAEMGKAFNYLGSRLKGLLAAEREMVADLSHRLRTPLTALRLQAEGMEDAGVRAALLADIDELARAVDGLIEEARRPAIEEAEMRSDLAAVLNHRISFWRVLADDQGRELQTEVPDDPIWVPAAAGEVGAAIDVLFENVLAHTAPGTSFSAALAEIGNTAQLVVEDEGGGFPHSNVTRRGTSGAGSTGLGLDIVDRLAHAAGGTLSISNRAEGGARVEILLPTIEGPG